MFSSNLQSTTARNYAWRKMELKTPLRLWGDTLLAYLVIRIVAFLLQSRHQAFSGYKQQLCCWRFCQRMKSSHFPTLGCCFFDHRFWQICCRQSPSFHKQMSHRVWSPATSALSLGWIFATNHEGGGNSNVILPHWLERVPS